MAFVLVLVAQVVDVSVLDLVAHVIDVLGLLEGLTGLELSLNSTFNFWTPLGKNGLTPHCYYRI